MFEEQEKRSWQALDRPDFDRDELARDLMEMAEANGGEYRESLKVDPAGRVVSASRYGDKSSAYLSCFLGTKDGEDPSIEDMYHALKDIGAILTGYEISIYEDRTAGRFEYRIKRKVDGV